jgi:hypothetical protein
LLLHAHAVLTSLLQHSRRNSLERAVQSRPLLLEFASLDALRRAADTLRASGFWDIEWVGAAQRHGDEVGIGLRLRPILRAAAIGAAVFAPVGWALHQFAMIGPFGQGPFAVAVEMALIGAAVCAAAMVLIATVLHEHALAGLVLVEDPERDRFLLVLHGAKWQQERVLEVLRAVESPTSVRAIVQGELAPAAP